MHGDSRHHAEAVAELEESVRRDPRLAVHPYLQASNTKLTVEVLEAVERGFQRALAEHPDDVPLMAQVATFYDRFGIWGEAAALWKAAAEESGEWNPYGIYAAASLSHTANVEETEGLLRKALAADPRETETHRLLGTVLLRAGRLDDAAEALRLGIRRAARPAVLHVALSEVLLQEGERAAAVAELEKAGELAPSDFGIQYGLGAAYLRAEDWRRAKMAFDRAVANDETRSDARYLRGVAAEQLYELAAARADYERAVAMQPENETYRAALRRVTEAFEQRGG